MTRKIRLLSLLLAIATITVSGCVGNTDQSAVVLDEGVDQEPVPGDWAVVSYLSEPDGLNRITATNASSSYLVEGAMGSFISEHLLGYDPETWRLERPILAESYPEISDDNLRYTFTVREGVRWHDGEPFTVEDVLFSIKATMLPLVDSAQIRVFFADLADVTVVGDRQIQFQVTKPSWVNVFNLGWNTQIVPKHVYDPDGVLDDYSYQDVINDDALTDPALRQFGQAFNTHPANRAPIGTGPYRFVSWDSGTEIVLDRNDDYWGQAAYLERIIVRFITDTTAALTALKSGETDLYPRVQPLQYDSQTSGAAFDSQLEKSITSIPTFYSIGWNTERPFFSDKRVRQAMTMLIPRQQLIDSVRFGLAAPAIGPFTPDSPDLHPTIEPWPYDPVRAAELLDEAGWVDSNGNGIRDKDGLEFSFEFLGNTPSVFTDQLLPVMRDELERVGIEMTERRVEFTTQIESAQDHQFDATSFAWVSELVNDHVQLWHSSSIPNRGSNYVSFDNAEADQVLEDALQEFDPVVRRELYWRLQEIIHEEQPYTFLFYPQEAIAYSNRFRNVNVLPASPGYDLTQWFVPVPLQKYSGSSPESGR
jgi:peptide/nickel transport system substrate-binding protein